MSDLILDIREAGGGPDAGWTAAWSLDGKPVAPEVQVGIAAARETRRWHDAFLARFERGGDPRVEPAVLRAFGRELFERWFAPVWSTLAPVFQGLHHRLLIRTPDRHVLNLPWELVEPAGTVPLGCDPAWSLRRTPLAALGDGGPLEAGPLRILFSVSAPLDQARLDYEREEEAMLRATGLLRDGVVVLFSESGTFDELAELVAQHCPHVVHLSGHGRLNADGSGTFAFEDERGHTDIRDAAEIANRVFRASGVRCVFLNACQTAQAAAAGLCQALAAAGVPLAIGWAASVADGLATSFAEEFYGRLVCGEPVAVAAAHARDRIRKDGHFHQGPVESQDATLALPQVYCSATGSGEVFDRTVPPRPYEGPRTRYALLEDGIKGLKEGFVGRRRQIQQLLPPLRDGDVTFAVLTGVGGAGKSTLATRAANRLEAEGFKVLGVRAPKDGATPASRGRAMLEKVRDAIGRAFLSLQRQDLYDMLTNPKVADGQRLRLAIDGLRQVRAALVLDNFEDLLTLKTRAIADPDLARFYRELALGVTAGSRVIVTCRYVPAETPDPVGQPNVLHLPLGDLDLPDFLKFMRRDVTVDRRMREGELPPDLLAKLYQTIGGTPRFLENVRKVLARIDPDDLLAELSPGVDGEVEAARQAYYEEIFVDRLFKSLPAKARGLISRLAVSELPLPIDGATAIAALGEREAAESLASAVAYGLMQEFAEVGLPTLYHPPGLLRDWLAVPSRLPEQIAQEVHRALVAFWRTSFESNRETELRVAVPVELMTCRMHARLGMDVANFRWSTVRMTQLLHQIAEWRTANALLEEVPEAERDGECWLGLAANASKLGEWRTAREYLEKGVHVTPEGTSTNAAIWHHAAMIDMNQGHYSAAQAALYRSLSVRQAIGDLVGEAESLHQLATIDALQGNHSAARDGFGNSLAIKQAIGERAGQAATWQNLGSIEMNEGNYPAARERFGKSLAIYQAFGDRAGEAGTWHQLGTIDVYEGNHSAAREKFGKSLAIKQAIGDQAGEANTWHNLGSIEMNEGNYPAARERFGRSLAIKQAIGDRVGEAGTWHQLATIDLYERNFPAARANFAKAMAINQAVGNRAAEAKAWHNLASIDLDERNFPAARANFAKAMAINQAVDDRAAEAATWFQFGVLARAIGRGNVAVLLIAIAWLIRSAIGDGEADDTLGQLLGLCEELKYGSAEIQRVMQEATRGYQTDRGYQMLQQAFPPQEETSPPV